MYLAKSHIIYVLYNTYIYIYIYIYIWKLRESQVNEERQGETINAKNKLEKNLKVEKLPK